MNKKTLVVSAVNLVSGGPFTILRDCLDAAAASLPDEWEIVALVHDPALLNVPRVRFVAVPHTLGSWLQRLRFEWWESARIAKELKADVWLSLQDITARTAAPHRYVYCHNASPFYKVGWREARMDRTFFLQTLLYKHFYRAFLRTNHGVIVQQEWMRRGFHDMYGGDLPVIVARPTLSSAPVATVSGRPNVFLYPSLPRLFKNFEIIGEAAKLLEARGFRGQEFHLTIRGDENAYAAELSAKYRDVYGIQFTGHKPREEMVRAYQDADVVLFPSKLESWGLPLSEAKSFGKCIFAADLPYAHESIGNYDKVAFFDPADPTSLADLLSRHIQGQSVVKAVTQPQPVKPYASTWSQLLWQLTCNA